MRLRFAPDACIAILDRELACFLVKFHMEENVIGQTVHDMEVKPRLLVESGDGEAKRAVEPLDDFDSLHIVYSRSCTVLFGRAAL
ncbi:MULTISPECIES: hypothetical protein [unclassified Shinella]|uniref:hypothetical protein n=1 Tax=unclassified Shinella TaxID=2643062 RepID=UPI0012FBFF43|nr:MULTISPECIES: hypothetical protein [unclassified Shinella]